MTKGEISAFIDTISPTGPGGVIKIKKVLRELLKQKKEGEIVTVEELEEALLKKQDTLISGENVKTVGGQSIVGKGNIEVGDKDAIKFVLQQLTEAQKAQARANIDAYKKPSTGIPASDIANGVIPDISGKQDTITDLQEIRNGASAGAIAYQKPSDGVPKSDLTSSVQASLSKADTAIQPFEFNELKEEVETIGNGAYEEAWDGSSTPVVADIPAGVSVTYNSTSYTGTLAASTSTVDKIYLVSDGNGNYDRYTTVEVNGAYSWKKVGSTAIPLPNYTMKSEFSQLRQKVTDIAGGQITPEVTWADGFLYKSGNTVATSSNANYKKSSVISVKNGDVVSFAGGSDSETISVYAICSYNNGAYTGVLLYSSLVQENIQWTAPSDMQIVISSKKTMWSGDVVIQRQSQVDVVKEWLAALQYVPNALDITTGAITGSFEVGGYLASGNIFTVGTNNKSIILPIPGGKSFDILANGTACIYAFLKSVPIDFSGNFDLSPYYATGASRSVANNRGQGTTPTDAKYMMLSVLVSNADWSARWAKVDGCNYAVSIGKQVAELQDTTESKFNGQNPPKRWVYNSNFQVNDLFINEDFFTSEDIANIYSAVFYNKHYAEGTYYVGLLFRDSSSNVVIDGRVLCDTETEADKLIASGFIDLPHIKYTFKVVGNDSTYSNALSLDSSVFSIDNAPYVKGLTDSKKLPAEQKLDVAFTTGAYINLQGVVTETSQNYRITVPIGVCPGDILKAWVVCGENSSVLCKKVGDSYLPLYAGIGGSTPKEYEYKAEEYCNIVVCYKGDFSATMSLVQDVTLLTPSLVKVPNCYVLYSGAKRTYTSSASYGISEPVRVFKNDRLELSIKANGGVTGVLSLCDKNGDKIDPIFVADGNNYTTYNYIVPDNGYVVVSGDFSTNPGPALVITRQNVRPSFEEMLNDTKHEYGYIREKHFYSEDYDNAIPEKYNTILCYNADTKANENHIVNAVSYPDGTIIACRAGGSVVKIAKDGTETTLLTITGAGDWRGMFIDSNNNVFVSPHNTVGGTGALSLNDRGLYRLPYNGNAFTKVISLYNPDSSVETETEANDDTIWTMCEDSHGALYAGVYAHSMRANPGIYKSENGGISWTYICNMITDGFVPATSRFGNAMHIHCIIYNEFNNALYCIVGEVETVFKSTDGGANWEDLHILVEDEKGTTLIAVPDGILIGSDGIHEGVISKVYSDDRTVRTVGKMWHGEFFGMRRSDVTGWIYAFTKIESTIGNSTIYPPVDANTDANALAAWKESASASNVIAWEKYNEWVSKHYTHDAIHPTSAAILVSRDNGESWEIIYKKDTEYGTGIGPGIFCVGYFKNGECLCGMASDVNGAKVFVNPVVVSEGKHKFTPSGIDLSGEIFIKTNTNNISHN